MINRRKKLVINQKFQYQQGVLAVSLAVIAANIFLLSAILMPESSGVVITSGTALAIGVAELVLVVAVWFASIRFSHKVAGPIFVFSRQIKAFCEGDSSARIKLREKDLFKEEADEINASLAMMDEKLSVLLQDVRSLQDAHGKGALESEKIEALATKVANFCSSKE